MKNRLNMQAWDDYQAYRRENRMRKLKLMSIERLQRWLCQQGDEDHQAEIVDQSIRNSWIGLFPLRNDTPVNGQQQPIRGSHDWYRERAEERVDTMDREEAGGLLERDGSTLRPTVVSRPGRDD